MSRNIPVRSAVVAITVGVLAVALLLGLILWGKHAQDEQGASAAQLPAGFTAIDADEIFETIADAQSDAGSWEATTLSVVQGQSQSGNVVQIEQRGDVQAFRVQQPNPAGGMLEGVWDGKTFFEKNPQGTGAEQWFSYPEDTFNADALNMISSNVAALRRGYATVSADVVGRELLTDLKGREVNTVKYLVILEPNAETAAAMPGMDPEAQQIRIELWLDKNDRPIQTQGISQASGGETTIFYSDYGKSFDIKAPNPDQVTERDLETQSGQ